MVIDDGQKPWIWVRRLEHEPLDTEVPGDENSSGPTIERAQKLLKDYSEKITNIQKDNSIPVRANKKKGLRSKKEVREEVMVEAANEFKRISEESKLTCGKWLFFLPAEHIDEAFARLSRELITGALSKTPAFCAKVATTPSDVGLNHRYLICLYLPDLYDKASVTEVLRAACRSTGIRPNSAKTDLYTLIGLDSKHPSGIKSTTLTEAYWDEANAKPSAGESKSTAASDKAQKKIAKRQRKEDDEDDVFEDFKEAVLDEGSDEQEEHGTRTSLIAANNLPFKAPKKAKARPENDSATEGESDDLPPAKPATSAPKGPLKPVADADSSSDDEIKKPKKIRRF